MQRPAVAHQSGLGGEKTADVRAAPEQCQRLDDLHDDADVPDEQCELPALCKRGREVIRVIVLEDSLYLLHGLWEM